MSDKAYLFLTPSISVLGGAERYMAGKAEWLTSKGWDVFIAGPCPVEPAVDYGGSRIIDIRSFNVRPYTMMEESRHAVIGALLDALIGYQCVFIESSTICFGFWGEYLASLLGAEHMIFHLSEELPSLSGSETDYLKTKRRRGELFFIKEGLARTALGPSVGNEAVLVAYMPPAVADVSCPEHLLEKKGYRLGCISRLDKPFLKNAIDGIACFSMKNPSARLEVVVIGGASTSSDEMRCRNMLLDAARDAFPVIFAGAMSPVPASLIQTFDFGFGKAGGALNVAGEGVPTLIFSIDTDQPMGVLGFDYNRNVCAYENEPVDLVEVLEQAITKNRYSERPLPMPVVLPASNYAKHFEAFYGHESPRNPLVPIRHGSFREHLKGLLFSVVGSRGYERIKKARGTSA